MTNTNQTTQHHAADQSQRVADLEAERDTARGAVREFEAKVFNQEHALNVLRACVDRHQRDAADPPGYPQDAVIRAAGLGALHTERGAAIKERDELRARLEEIEGQEPVAWRRADWSGSESPTLQFDPPPDRPTVRDELTNPIWTPLYARPVPATPDGWRLVPVDPTPGMLEAGLSAQNEAWNVHYAHIYAEMIAAAPEAAR
jgi:hypothetical protein